MKTKSINIVVENNNKIEVKDGKVWLLFWNNITKDFTKIPSNQKINDIVKEFNIKTKKTQITINEVIYRGGNHQARIMDLLKKYDKESYLPYDHHRIENIKKFGLTTQEEEEEDDYLPQELNNYHQGIIYKPNKTLGIGPCAYWERI